MPAEITTLLTFFGGTGDLAKRKLYPSTYNLFKKGFLQEHFAVIGTARQELTTEEFHEMVRESIADFVEDQANAPLLSKNQFHFVFHNTSISLPVPFTNIINFFTQICYKNVKRLHCDFSDYSDSDEKNCVALTAFRQPFNNVARRSAVKLAVN